MPLEVYLDHLVQHVIAQGQDAPRFIAHVELIGVKEKRAQVPLGPHGEVPFPLAIERASEEIVGRSA